MLIKRGHMNKILMWVLVLGIIVVSAVVFYQSKTLFGANYTFTQTDWLGNASSTATAIHSTNQNNWTYFKNASSSIKISVGGEISLATSTASSTQTSNADFNAGTTSQTQVVSNSVILGSSGTGWARTSIDGTSLYFSTAVGSDGYARISYYRNSGTYLKFVRCTNSSCSAKNTTAVDSTANVGLWTSLALGSDGYARISYYDTDNDNLKFVQCTNDDCTAKNITTIDSTGNVGEYTALAMGSDGYARIAYRDGTNSSLKFVQCTNTDCSANNITTITSSAGYYNSIDIGSDGYARIAYTNNSSSVKFVQCTNDDCSTKNINTVASIDHSAGDTGVVMGLDGYARVLFSGYNGGYRAFYVQCTNNDCSTKNITTIGSSGPTSFYPVSFTLGTDGYARVVRMNNYNLYLTQCSDDNCSTKSDTTIHTGTPYDTGRYSSVALNGSDYGRISYYRSSGTAYFAYEYATYYSSGTFISDSINVGQSTASWGNLSWSESGTGTTTIKARTDADGDFSNATVWGNCSNIANGAAISTGACSTNGHQYIQYQASLSGDTSNTPSLDDITIEYNYYATSSQTLISSPYNSSESTNAMGSINWDEDVSLPSGTTVTASLRTASTSAAISSATWFDFTNGTANCSKTIGSVSCPSSALAAGLKDSTNNQWFQYKTTLTSNGDNAPTVSEVRIQYVVNAPPQFDSSFGTNGISILQVATSTDNDWGKVKIQYSIRDIDTASSTNTPGYNTPSFEYNTGSGWKNITSEYLAAGDLNNKAVNEGAYNIYTATWDAQSQVSGTYTASAQVRVTMNDNEVANSTAQATSGNFVLDTKDPIITTFTIDSSVDTTSINISDDVNINYRLSNNSDLSADGSNASSSQWQSVGAASLATSTAWVFTGSPSFEIAYLEVRDVYGNTNLTSATAPSTPTNVDIKDTSNTQSGEYRQFISWSVYSATTSAQFSNYKIYRSTNGSNYPLLTTIGDVNTNYHSDDTVSSSTTYYYKLTIIDSNSDISNYSTILSDIPNGQGGTDYTAPTISNVQSAEVQATWAKITWTTDEISDSTVEFSTAAVGNYASSTTVVSLTTSHEVVISGLTPNTSYIFRVKSVDIFNNETIDNNSGSGYSFTTEGGPIISDITTESVEDQSATIIWNTNENSDSYVVYATTQSNCQNDTNTSEVGSASLVGGSGSLYQHRVELTGLNQKTNYYYYVKSTDSSSDTATDKNSGACYSFITTYDTKAPVISNISTPVITSSAIIVLWQTDELADSQVEYGTVSGSYPNTTIIDSTLSISHAVSLSSLSAETTYYFRVKSNDAQGNLTTSSENSVTTTVSGQVVQIVYLGGGGGVIGDTTPPQISNINVSDIGAFEAVVSFNTNEATIGYVLYGQDSNYGSTVANSEFKTQHSIKLFGLKLGTEHHFQVKANDKSGNFSKSADQTFTTKFAAEALEELITLENAAQFQEQLEGIIESVMPSLIPPFISKVDINEITEDSVVIEWSTNVSSYGSVAYALDAEYNTEQANPYSIEISQTGDKDREHWVELISLFPGTLYHFQAKSFVFPGVIGKSKDLTFYTKMSVVKPEIVKLGNTQLEIRWITDGETSSFVEYKNLITGKINRTGDSEKVKTHSVSLENLVPDNIYELRVFGYDVKNNIIEGNPITVRTKKDIVPPIISSIKINNALLPGRTDRLQTVVSWRTNEPSNSLVYFKEGVGVEDITVNKVGQDYEFTTDHIVIITTLKPSKVYRIKIVSTDESDNIASSPIRTILTPHSAESVFDIITRNLQETFGFLKKLRQ